MDPGRWREVVALFNDALERPASERPALLAGAAPELAAEVEQLLAEWDDDPDFLETQAASAPAAVGAYQVVSELGRGGMGTVYAAVRDDDELGRQVAIKLVRPGMGSDEVLRRFRAERHILAALEHPNIARLLDAGTAEDGRPYLVMELVEGATPIDAHCRDRELGVRERLALFLSVCDAVEAAHRQLVVHRDLKASNVLVSSDGAVKLVDFGVAKLLDTRAEITALLTRTGVQLMTPATAAPEQLGDGPITTSTDVYGLGVLLYQLLADRLPFDPAGLSRAELLEAIEHRAPPAPSAVAPERARWLRGDLDTIAAKALRKEPDRRYASAAALAADLRDHLESRPIAARPESFGYVVRKFVGRHRFGVAAAALLAALLVAGVAGVVWQARVAASERDVARTEARKAERLTALITGIFESADPMLAAGAGDTPVREVVERSEAELLRKLDAEPEIKAEMQAVLGRLYANLGDLERATALLEASLETRRELFGARHREVADTLHELARVLALRHRNARARAAAEEALELRVASYGRSDVRVAETLQVLGDVLRMLRELDAAERRFREALAIDDRSAVAARAYSGLASTLKDQERYDDAVAAHRRSIELTRAIHGERHLKVALRLDLLEDTLSDRGQHAAAERAALESLAIKREWLDGDHPLIVESLYDVATGAYFRGDYAAAEDGFRQVDQMRRRLFGDRDAFVGRNLSNLGMALMQQDKLAEAVTAQRQAVAIMELAVPATSAEAHVRMNLAKALRRAGELDAARAEVTAALQLQRRLVPDGPLAARMQAALGLVELDRGELDAAREHLDTAVASMRRLFPEGHTALEEALIGVGRLALRQRNSKRAASAAREALALREKRRNTPDWQLAEARAMLEKAREAQ